MAKRVIVSRTVTMTESVTIDVPDSVAMPEYAAKEYVDAALRAGQPLNWQLGPEKNLGPAYSRTLTATIEGAAREEAVPVERPGEAA